MQGRIAVFIGELFKDYESRVFCGLKDVAEKNNVSIDVFSNHGIFSANYLNTCGEINIIKVPDFSVYDGVIVAPDTLTVEGMYEELYKLIKDECTCPVVSIRSDCDDFVSVLVDDQSSIEAITEHFINVHGCKKIFYMSGTEGMGDSGKRLAGYKHIMKKYAFPVRDTMIFHGNYWVDKGKQCLSWFDKDPDKPEAIICANDYMAISLYREFEEREMKIPEEIKLSGYDNIVDGQLLEKRLASASVPAEDMGAKAVELVLDMAAGKEVPKKVYVSSRIIMEGTCGCTAGSLASQKEASHRNLAFYQGTIASQLAFAGSFDNCETTEAVLLDAFNHSNIFGYKNIFVCFCDENESSEPLINEYSQKMHLTAIFSKSRGFIKCDETFQRNEIIPEHYRRDNPLLAVFPMHHDGHCIGYMAVTVEHVDSMKIGFVLWAKSFAEYLDKIKRLEKNKEQLRYREESFLDNLTALMNKKGFDVYLQKALAKASETDLHIVSVDIDNLRIINSKFGHAVGDSVIRTIGTYLKYVQNERVGCARMGGDEFLIAVLDSEENTKEICKYINRLITNYCTYVETRYELSVSMGYSKYEVGENISFCINRANENMQLEKEKKREI